MIYTKENIKNLSKRISLIPPVIINLNNMRIAVFTNGNENINIDENVTLEDIHSIWKQKEYEINLTPVKEWDVKGSKGDIYKVSLLGNKFSCTCVGFQFHRKCKHIKSIKEKYKIL